MYHFVSGKQRDSQENKTNSFPKDQELNKYVEPPVTIDCHHGNHILTGILTQIFYWLIDRVNKNRKINRYLNVFPMIN